MKITSNSGINGLDRLLEDVWPSGIDYGYEEVIEYLVMIDNLDIEIALDMLASCDYEPDEVNTNICKHDTDIICCRISNMTFDCEDCPYEP